jgi:hypothetical protein
VVLRLRLGFDLVRPDCPNPFGLFADGGVICVEGFTRDSVWGGRGVEAGRGRGARGGVRSGRVGEEVGEKLSSGG